MQSLAEKVALLSPAERDEVLADLDPDVLRWDPEFWMRPEQLPPPSPPATPTDWSVWLYMAGRGSGKAIDDDELLPTPVGWTRMGDVSVGDLVLDHAGSPTTVLGVYPQGSVSCSRVTFSDGSTVDVSDDHLWTVLHGKTIGAYARDVDVRNGDPDWWCWSRPTGSVLRRGRDGREHVYTYGGSRRHTGPVTVTTSALAVGDAIPCALPLQLPNAVLPVDPYVFGAWLGDGSTGNGSICSGQQDVDHLRAQLLDRGYGPLHEKVDVRTGVVGLHSQRLHDELKTLGLAPRRRTRKFVPEDFLRGSVEQRLDLLRGLMDTDGHIPVRCCYAGVGFINQSLADATHELAISLGYQSHCHTRTLVATKHRPERLFYGVDVRPTPDRNPFLLPRKASRVTEMPRSQATRKTMRRVVAVESIGDRKATCIKVDTKSSLFLAGRGMVPTHNTRAAAEWIRSLARRTDTPLRFGLVARTAADVRDVLVEGESGILSVSPPSERPEYFPSKRKLVWTLPNGIKHSALAFTADEPDTLRGPQFHYAWADEAASWRQLPDLNGMTAWDNLRVATRLGAPTPKICVTTTPKRVSLMRRLLKEAESPERSVVVTRGKTSDNASNLPAHYVEGIYGVYGGTRMALQELEGEMLDDVEGALWTQELIDEFRSVLIALPAPLKFVGVDPTVAERPGDECGVVVVASTADKDLYRRQAYVLEDTSIKGSPETWARRVVDTARRWTAPVVCETNQGGALVRNAIAAIDPSIPIYEVHSKYGKQLRAEPVALAYEQGRVHHLGTLPDLETQMTQWIPGESSHSPDRVDALVHALTALLITPPKGFYSGSLRAHSPAQHRLPSPASPSSRSSRSSPSRTLSSSSPAPRSAKVFLPRSPRSGL